MTDLVRYEAADGIATLSMDDGKANALSHAMFEALNAALDRAQADKAVVVLTGRAGKFCGGFDLPTLMGGGESAAKLLRSGFELSARLLSFPNPVVIACSGHAMAMGVFLLCSGDWRVGVDGEFKICANEVSIGLTMPRSAIEICRQRLAPAHFSRAMIDAEIYAPSAAVAAGFLDRVVPAESLMSEAHAEAVRMTKLNRRAHAATKLRVREQALAALRAAIEADDAEFRATIR